MPSRPTRTVALTPKKLASLIAVLDREIGVAVIELAALRKARGILFDCASHEETISIDAKLGTQIGRASRGRAA